MQLKYDQQFFFQFHFSCIDEMVQAETGATNDAANTFNFQRQLIQMNYQMRYVAEIFIRFCTYIVLCILFVEKATLLIAVVVGKRT